MKTWTADDWDEQFPGLLDALEAKGVELSNNAGAIIVEGYLGDIVLSVAAHAR